MLPCKLRTAGCVKVARVELSTAGPGYRYSPLKMSHFHLNPSARMRVKAANVNWTWFAWVKRNRSASRGVEGQQVVLRKEAMQMPAPYLADHLTPLVAVAARLS